MILYIVALVGKKVNNSYGLKNLEILTSSYTSIDFKLLLYGLAHGNQLFVAIMTSL